MSPSDFTFLQTVGRAWNMVGSAYNKWLREKAIELAPKPKANDVNGCKTDITKQDNSQQSSR